MQEHFFWGVSNGVALELGASEGTDSSNSMTFSLEQRAQWRRILIEGDPMVHPQLKAGNPNAFTVGACICRKAAQVSEKSQTTPLHFHTVPSHVVREICVNFCESESTSMDLIVDQ